MSVRTDVLKELGKITSYTMPTETDLKAHISCVKLFNDPIDFKPLTDTSGKDLNITMSDIIKPSSTSNFIVSNIPFSDTSWQSFIINYIVHFKSTYDQANFNHLGGFSGIDNTLKQIIVALLYANALTDGVTTKIKSPGDKYIVNPTTMTPLAAEREMKTIINKSLIPHYTSLLKCLNDIEEQKNIDSRLSNINSISVTMSTLHEKEIANLNDFVKETKISSNYLTDEDIINLYNNRYWVKKGNVSQPLSPEYIPLNQRRYYYGGH